MKLVFILLAVCGAHALNEDAAEHASLAAGRLDTGMDVASDGEEPGQKFGDYSDWMTKYHIGPHHPYHATLPGGAKPPQHKAKRPPPKTAPPKPPSKAKPHKASVKVGSNWTPGAPVAAHEAATLQKARHKVDEAAQLEAQLDDIKPSAGNLAESKEDDAVDTARAKLSADMSSKGDGSSVTGLEDELHDLEAQSPVLLQWASNDSNEGDSNEENARGRAEDAAGGNESTQDENDTEGAVYHVSQRAFQRHAVEFSKDAASVRAHKREAQGFDQHVAKAEAGNLRESKEGNTRHTKAAVAPPKAAPQKAPPPKGSAPKGSAPKGSSQKGSAPKGGTKGKNRWAAKHGGGGGQCGGGGQVQAHTQGLSPPRPRHVGIREAAGAH